MIKFLLALLILVFSFSSVFAAPSVTPTSKFKMYTTGTWQGFHQGNSNGATAGIASGFQNANSNLLMWVNLLDGVDVYADYYISVPPHAGQFYGDEGYVKVSKLPGENPVANVLNGLLFDRGIEVKAGQFELDYGNNHFVRSNNAVTDQNPLIGNYLVDADVVEFGLEMIGGFFGGAKWVLGVANGVNSQGFNSGKSYSLHAKIGYDNGLALSGYRADQCNADSTTAGLFRGPRNGSEYAAPTVGTSSILTGSGAGNLTLGQGKDVSGAQIDFAFGNKVLDIKGMVGYADDAGCIVSSKEVDDQWMYYGVEARLNTANPDFYLAARYSGAYTKMFLGAAQDGATVDRFQAGFGYTPWEDTLFKTELVYEKYNKFTKTYTGDPYFYGVITQISTAFTLFDNLAKK